MTLEGSNQSGARPEEMLSDEQRARVLPKLFADSLRLTNFDARNVKLWQVEGGPAVLVREYQVQDGLTVDKLEALILEGNGLFKEMHDQYRLRVVSARVQREKNQAGNETIFTVV